MARSKSSNRWLEEHVNDPYVKKAQVDGYRARAAYKLLELNEKDKLIRPGMMVVDLGSAPGSWSQIAGRLVGVKGRVIASDILPMDSLEHVDFIQGDFTEEAVFNQIMEKLGGNRGGPDAAIKHLYKVNLQVVNDGDLLTKTLIKDIKPVLGATTGTLIEKVEGTALMANGDVYIVTENDGVNDHSGETQLINLGKLF